METKHKKYDKYKLSGIEWLGEVPEHWDVKRLKYMTSINDEALAESTPSDYEILYVDIGNVDSAKGITKKELMVFEKAPSRARRIVQNGDTIVSTVRTYLRAIAPIEIAEDNLIVSTGFAVVRPREINSNYLSYALRSPYFVETVVSRSVGVSYPAINASDLATIEITFPNISEQQAIVDFLDRRTGEIDGLIAKKERVIELLREKRTALISHAVTKGLNPDAKMKDSGIEWLGDVPEHWEVKRLRFIIKDGLVNGIFKKKEFFGSGVKLVNVFDIYRDNFLVDFDSLERVDANELEATKYAVEPGNIFFVRSSLKLEGVGKSVCIAKVPEATVFECHVVRIKPDENRVQPEFLINYLNSTTIMDRLVSLANTVTMTTLDQMKMKDLEIAVPPVNEQEQIVEKLKREYYITQTLIDKVTEVIEKLKEYRTALISAAVTGKIDVKQEVSV